MFAFPWFYYMSSDAHIKWWIQAKSTHTHTQGTKRHNIWYTQMYMHTNLWHLCGLPKPTMFKILPALMLPTILCVCESVTSVTPLDFLFLSDCSSLSDNNCYSQCSALYWPLLCFHYLSSLILMKPGVLPITLVAYFKIGHHKFHKSNISKKTDLLPTAVIKLKEMEERGYICYSGI